MTRLLLAVFFIFVPIAAQAAEAAVDWAALARAHDVIIRKYSTEVRAKKVAPAFEARFALESAGIENAVDVPVSGITPREAAAILNDYGFLLVNSSGDAALAEHAMRRAIELDPERGVAYLNLGDLLRTQLGAYTGSGQDADTLRAEIARDYRTYLKLGGRPTASIRMFLGPAPDAQAGGDVCAAIAAYANAGRLGELVSDKGANVPFKGRRLNLAFSIEGTGLFAQISATDAKTGKELDDDEIAALPFGSDQICCGDKLGLLVYHKEPYILSYGDLSSPDEAVSLTTGKACAFDANVREWAGPRATQPALCQALVNGQRPPAFSFDGHFTMNNDQTSRDWNDDAQLKGVRRLDVANNGKPITVMQLESMRKGGVPCFFTVYDAVNADASGLADHATRELLFRLQDLSPDSIHPIALCGNDTRFFTYNNRMYFESRSGAGHRVATLVNGEAHEVCDFKSHTTFTGQATEYHPSPN